MIFFCEHLTSYLIYKNKEIDRQTDRQTEKEHEHEFKKSEKIVYLFQFQKLTFKIWAK